MLAQTTEGESGSLEDKIVTRVKEDRVIRAISTSERSDELVPVDERRVGVATVLGEEDIEA